LRRKDKTRRAETKQKERQGSKAGKYIVSRQQHVFLGTKAGHEQCPENMKKAPKKPK
jgi:hypothetical protein